ncbi:unnamed protein product [Cuscuta epithymum]|uniref:Uncharacterized protein n=1 Tax=Cuscuta epithymum TaxID=186058 RepID=A0AAV0ELS5_9ASTE|nr:unnamed protein product [Cuscuta epithymum]
MQPVNADMYIYVELSFHFFSFSCFLPSWVLPVPFFSPPATVVYFSFSFSFLPSFFLILETPTSSSVLCLTTFLSLSIFTNRQSATHPNRTNRIFVSLNMGV